MLQLSQVHYRPAACPKDLLNGINLKAEFGNPIVIAGASGEGKTSLVEVISGLSKAQKGIISWNNKALSPRQRRWLCGVVFQFPERHFLGLTVSQELRLGHRRLSTEKQTLVLKKVGLSDIDLRQAPEKLSGGQQRRLALAIQLLRKPKVLLLDEPTAGLDWSVRNEVLGILNKLTNDQILIIVTHEPELFHNLSSKYLLKEGSLKATPTSKKS
ncbi:ABC transporter ATP-binding protein [Prochlorococcus sp. MIT 1300]|uniref:ABC transporter ATP-binding protein n=1 Tax=Prochlorococcus sp. MIT 1300 TaxID=3096218 RepID=UPI002A74C25B|nr:ABC transporter ATP-binding protein [Prochlorococcus sp. MIT 1300]